MAGKAQVIKTVGALLHILKEKGVLTWQEVQDVINAGIPNERH